MLVHISCIQAVFIHPIVTKQLIAPTVAAEGEKAPYLGLNEASCSFSCAYTCICIFLRLSLDWSLTVACSPERKIKSRNSRCECGRTCTGKANPRGRKMESFVSSAVGHEKSPQSWAKEFTRLKYFPQALTEGCCCTWCEVTTALADRSFPGYAVPRVTCCMF